MDSIEFEFSFVNLDGLSPEDQQSLKDLLSPLNRKNVNVKFPWKETHEDPKQDFNGNSIDEVEVEENHHQTFTYVHSPMNPNVILQHNLIQMPGVSDGMPIHSSLYSTGPFVGYPPINHEMLLQTQPIPMSQNTEVLSPTNEYNDCSSGVNIISSQPNMHTLPFTTIPQHFGAQSNAAVFYSPADHQNQLRGQAVVCIPVPYPTNLQSYQLHQSPPEAIPVVPVTVPNEDSKPSLVSSENVESNSKNFIQSEEISNVDDANKHNVDKMATDGSFCENAVSFGADDVKHQISEEKVDGGLDNGISSEDQLPEDLGSTKPKSWASLFSKGSINPDVSSDKPTNNDPCVINGSNANVEAKKFATFHDRKSLEIGSYLGKFQIDFKSVHIMPRGLVNRSNWCYINATLQALLVCPPFYNLLKNIPTVPGQKRHNSCTPILDSLIEFVENFMKIHLNYEKSKRKEDLVISPSFEPRNIYEMLSEINSNCIKGRQEDAEEFLSCILDGLHEEMVAVINNSKNKINLEDSSINDGVPNGDSEVKMNGCSNEDWLVINAKNKGMITRSANYVRSPVSEIFGGQLRSVLKKSGADPSANLEPFFTLQLDVQSNQVNSIKDALQRLVSKESVEGCICSKTGVQVEASRRLTLEDLPSVLILHIKRFVYNKDGGCQKILKPVEYDVNLDLNIDLLSPEVKTRYKKMKSYRLFAVVYHDGKEAVKGHYITDAYHSGSNGWLRFDDSVVTRVTENQVLKHCSPCLPYLLFYKRQLNYSK